MAAVDIICPHCNRNQKVAEHRLTETVYCLVCQQLIEEVYLYKVAPKQQELTIKLKGRIVSEFGTTKLEDLKSKSDEYTGKFEPVDDEDSGEVDALEETTRLFETSTYRALPSRKRLSTAARTYLIGGGVVALLAIAVTALGVAMLADDEPETAEIQGIGADGTRIERYPSGARKAEWRVVNGGGIDVTWQEWHEDGSLKTIGTYLHGNKVGSWRGWHPGQRPAFEQTWENGLPVGHWIEWHANGQKSVEGNYVAGEKDGDWRAWYRDGSQKSLESYEKGKPVGDWFSRYEGGETMLTGSYVNGRREGRWVTYHNNGAEEHVEHWRDGMLHGESWGGYRNRQRSFKGEWKEGRREGVWTWWHSNARMAKLGEYKNGAEAGQWREWHVSGTPRRTGSFTEGARAGTWEHFDEDGNLSLRQVYADGTLSQQKWYFREVEVSYHSESYPSGKLRKEWTTTLEGNKLHGYQRAYYSNEMLAEIGTWKDGRRDGTWRTYDETGNTLTEETWKDGVKAE